MKKKPAKDSDAISEEWWAKRRDDIKAELSKPVGLRQTVTATFGRPGCPGTFTIEAYHNDFPMPLAVMWYSYVGLDKIQINNIYTFEPVRRCGLMSFLQECMLKWIHSRSLVTCAGTQLGKAWMLKNGWIKTDAGWEHKAG
jgi:hypothetical protein